MPVQSESQRKMIFARRNKYKTKKDTPAKWKFIWDKGWENKGDLPEKAESSESTLTRYLSIIAEENSVKTLTNVGLVDRLVEFIRKNPFPKDHAQFRKWAKDMGYEDTGDDAEEYAYAMLTLILCGGKSKGKEIEASEKNKAIGDQIENEHVEWDTNNAVLHRMQMVLQQKIRNDHLAEDKNYYINGADFIKELKKEK